MKKVKILHVVSCLCNGGTERYLINNLKYIDKSRFEFVFLVLGERDELICNEIKNNGGRIVDSKSTSLHSIRSFARIFKNCIKNEK